MNSFSHDDISYPSKMDEKIYDFMKSLESSGVLNSSMVIFLSDHGIRFGEIRYTRMGWLEERLPYIYLWIPNWWRNLHPKEYKNLQAHSDRFTTPYDLFMTLQDVLANSVQNYSIRPSTACANCASFFEEPTDRNCEDTNIEPHWCTCENYVYENPKDFTVIGAAKFIVKEINKKIHKLRKCHYLKLDTIISSSVVRKSDSFYVLENKYLIVLRTTPDAVFEATVGFKGANLTYSVNYSLLGQISRLDSYATTSICINESKLYCICKFPYI